MKKEGHPKYNEVEFVCSCGNKIKTFSTTNRTDVAICSACHPFYTGKEKLIDSAGRIEKFKKKYASLEKSK